MISKKTAERIDEIDFETIINSSEPGGLIRYLALNTQKLKKSKRGKFFAASAAAYYCHLKGIKPDIKELNKDKYLLTWVNTCLAEDNLTIMLIGIYQLIKWEKELC